MRLADKKPKKGVTLKPKLINKRKPLLMELLLEHAERHDWSAPDLADKLEISYSYFASLRNGSAAVEEISYELASRVSAMLGMPTVVTQLVIGQLHPEDLYQVPQNVEESLDAALAFMQRDKEWSGFLPNSIYDSAREVKYALVRAYEKASGRILIPTKMSFEEMRQNYLEVVEGRNKTPSE